MIVKAEMRRIQSVYNIRDKKIRYDHQPKDKNDTFPRSINTNYDTDKDRQRIAGADRERFLQTVTGDRFLSPFSGPF